MTTRESAVAEGVAAIDRYGRSMAIGAHARGNDEEERRWLDLLINTAAVLAALDTTPQPALGAGERVTDRLRQHFGHNLTPDNPAVQAIVVAALDGAGVRDEGARDGDGQTLRELLLARLCWEYGDDKPWVELGSLARLERDVRRWCSEAILTARAHQPTPPTSERSAIGDRWRPGSRVRTDLPTPPDDGDEDPECTCGRSDRTNRHEWSPGCDDWPSDEDDQPTPPAQAEVVVAHGHMAADYCPGDCPGRGNPRAHFAPTPVAEPPQAEVEAVAAVERVRTLAENEGAVMAQAWGGDMSWVTNGTKVAALVAVWLDRALDQETGQ